MSFIDTMLRALALFVHATSSTPLIPSAPSMMIRWHPQVCGTHHLSSLRHHLMAKMVRKWVKNTPKKGSKNPPKTPPKRGQKWPFLGVPGGPPGGAPGGPRGGSPGGAPGGQKMGKFGDPLGQISNHCVPTGRVIKYPRKCALFPPRGAPPGPPRDPPKKGPKMALFWGSLGGSIWGQNTPFSGGSGRPPRTPRLRESVPSIQLAAASL